MRYEHFEPPEDDAAPEGPSKEALLLQIEADHYAATKRDAPKEELHALDERHRLVKATKSDEAARKAYADAIAEANKVTGPEAEAPAEPDGE